MDLAIALLGLAIIASPLAPRLVGRRFSIRVAFCLLALGFSLSTFAYVGAGAWSWPIIATIGVAVIKFCERTWEGSVEDNWKWK